MGHTAPPISRQVAQRLPKPTAVSEHFNIVKLAILPKLTHRFSAASLRITVVFFAEIVKLSLKFKWKSMVSRIAKTVSKLEERVPDFKITIVMYVVLTLLASREIATNTRKVLLDTSFFCTMDVLGRVYTLHPES